MAGRNGSTIDDSAIQAELRAQVAASTLPMPTSNTLYAVYFPQGKTITSGGGSSGVQFCAYHGTVAAGGGLPELRYSVLPDFTTGGMTSGCGGGSRFQNETSVSSHEMIETVTDPEVGVAPGIASPLAWYDATNGEIGDICNAQQATVVGGDGATYTVQKEFSNHYNDCIATAPGRHERLQHGGQPDLGLGDGRLVGPSSTVSTAVTSGSAQAVGLSAAGLPSGATASFSPTSVTAGGSSTLTLATSRPDRGGHLQHDADRHGRPQRRTPPPWR